MARASRKNREIVRILAKRTSRGRLVATLPCPLTTRQRTLCQLLADGRRLVDLGKELGASKTLLTQRADAIRDLLDAKTTTHAVVIAVRNGWVR